MENVCGLYLFTIAVTPLIFTRLALHLPYCFPAGTIPTHAASHSMSVCNCAPWFSRRCLIILEGDDSSYGGVFIVVLRAGSVLSQGACPHLLAVSLDLCCLILEEDQARKAPGCAS